jgi:iron complex transport system ATP-binding protein
VSELLSATDVHLAYGDRAVLRGVTFTARQGEVVALVGPNGAGKTTLLKVLAGILAPARGRVDVVQPRARSVAYLAQAEELPAHWTVREIVELGRLPYVGFWRELASEDASAIDRAMARTTTTDLATRTVDALSGGERQRVALARALAQEPRVLLLDEPTTHLDLRHQAELFAALRQEARSGMAVVAVMHDLGFAAQADRCVLLADGVVVAEGAPSDSLRADVLARVFGTDIEVLRTADGRIGALVPRGPGASPSSRAP